MVNSTCQYLREDPEPCLLWGGGEGTTAWSKGVSFLFFFYFNPAVCVVSVAVQQHILTGAYRKNLPLGCLNTETEVGGKQP